MTDMKDIGFPSTYLVWSIASRNLSSAVLCAEIADNAFGAAAGNANNLWIELRQDRAIFTDDGVGMADIWKLFELGGHLHDPSKTTFDIGHFGQGAKDALLSLGWKIRVQTVRDGVYHHHSVDWLPVAEAESPYAWPKRYKGTGLPAHKAPARIRSGGTVITVTGLHKGKRLPTIDALRAALVRLFKPALRSGRKIHITVGERTAALDSAETVRVDDRIEASGEVSGMPFKVIAGALLEHSPVHNKMFYGFGHRVLAEDTKLCGESLPPLFTCEVQLGGAWKPHLQTNKLGIAAYKDDLQSAVLDIVRPLWDATKAISDEARVDFINAKLARATAKIFAFRKAGEGHNPGPEDALRGKARRSAKSPSPNAGPGKDRTATPGAEGGAIAKRPKANGIKYRKLDEMDDNYVVDVAVDDAGLEVRLNGNIDAIRLAYSRPFKIFAIWPVIASGIAAYLMANPDEIDALIPRYEDLLGVNMDDPNELSARLFTYLIKMQPSLDDAKSFEPKAKEIA